MTIIPFHIFMAFNSLQSAFTYIITLNPSEIDSFFSILLAAQWSGKSSEPDLSSNPGNDPPTSQPAMYNLYYFSQSPFSYYDGESFLLLKDEVCGKTKVIYVQKHSVGHDAQKH